MPDASRYIRLAKIIFNRYFSKDHSSIADRDDIVQAALLCLMQRMRRRPDVDWERCAYSTLYRGMLDEFRRVDPLSRAHRKQVRRGESEFAAVVWCDETHAEVAEDVVDLIAQQEQADILRRTVETLPERLKAVATALLDERKQRDLAAELQVSESRICQMRVQTFRTLRACLSAQGIHR